jgi:superfamily II DNA/RNA helicase
MYRCRGNGVCYQQKPYSAALTSHQGCNIPDVDIVVQWKLPGSVYSFVQRAGRAGRDGSRTGLAVLLVERAAYEVDLDALYNAEAVQVGPKKKTKGGKKAAEKTVKAGKAYASAHGVNRGSHHGKSDAILAKTEALLDPKAPDEGLYVLVQTGVCRRQVLTKIYKNTVACK